MKISVKTAKKGVKAFRRAGLIFTAEPRVLTVTDKPAGADEITKDQYAALKKEPMLTVTAVKETKEK